MSGLATCDDKYPIHEWDRLLPRKSWQYHGTECWYIGPAHGHYRCLKCYLPITTTEVVSENVKLLPAKIPIPQANLDDYTRSSIQELIHLLHN